MSKPFTVGEVPLCGTPTEASTQCDKFSTYVADVMQKGRGRDRRKKLRNKESGSAAPAN